LPLAEFDQLKWSRFMTSSKHVTCLVDYDVRVQCMSFHFVISLELANCYSTFLSVLHEM